MDNWDKRVQATVVIWIGVAIALGFSGAGDVSNFSDEIITFVLAGAAFLSTTAVWYLGRETAQSSQNNKLASSSQGEKAKNETTTYEDARVRLLLELMDDEQRTTLRQQLLDDLQADGESVSLSDLLNEQPKRSRR
jgi:hypothetical protein